MKAIAIAFLLLVLAFLGKIIKCEFDIIRDQIKIAMRRQQGESYLAQCREEDSQ